MQDSKASHNLQHAFADLSSNIQIHKILKYLLNIFKMATFVDTTTFLSTLYM